MVVFLRLHLKFILLCISLLTIQYSLYTQNSIHLDSLFKKFDKEVKINFVEAKSLAKHTQDEAEKLNDKNYLFQSYINSIKICRMSRDYEKARVLIDKALNIENFILENTLRIDLYNEISYLEGEDTNADKAFIYSEKAMQLALNSNDSLRLCKSLINKGGLFINQQDFDEAKKYLFRAKSIAKNNHYYNVLSDAYLSLAETNYFVNKDSAIYYYNNALKNAIKANNKYKEASICSNFAFLYVYHSDEDKAKPILDKAEVLSKEVGSQVILHNVYYTLGSYYEVKENYDLSISNYKKAIIDYGDYVGPIQLSNTYIMLSGALWHNGDYKEAYDYQESYINLNDSIFNIRKTKEFDNIRTKYEVEKKDTAIALLEKENQIAETRKKWLTTSAIFLLGALIGLYLFYKYRRKTHETILLQEKALHKKEAERLQKEQELNTIKANIEGQEKERNRLAKELHDGVGGQLASINLSLSHINAELKNKAITDVSNNISSSFKELRTLSHSLSANAIKGKSLEILLVELKDLYDTSNGFEIEVSVFPDDILNNLGSEVSHHLYRIMQELMANISKHANAKSVQWSLNRYSDTFVAMIEDDGCGFIVENINAGIGIKNIEERVIALQGDFRIDSTPSKGTQVIIEIPLKQ